MAHPKHQSVRDRYGCCCDYCGVSETDAGGELTVDHYQPVSAGGDDSDDNLVYACIRCNLYKSNFSPTAEEIATGKRVLHPLFDNLSLHYQENVQTGELEPLTETGKAHIELLELNRPPLVAHREREWTRTLNESFRLSALADAAEVNAKLKAVEQYIKSLERQAGMRPE